MNRFNRWQISAVPVDQATLDRMLMAAAQSVHSGPLASAPDRLVVTLPDGAVPVGLVQLARTGIGITGPDVQTVLIVIHPADAIQ